MRAGATAIRISLPQAQLVDPAAGKDILFFSTNRAHIARQQMLFQELSDRIHVVEISTGTAGQTMDKNALDFIGGYFVALDRFKPKAVIIRADRYEQLPAAMLAAYKGIPVFHIEGGDMSGAIDNKVRHAISHLADYHFCTNEQSRQRLVAMGLNEERIWNYGSLDAEYAHVRGENLKHPFDGKPFALILFHPIPGEQDITPWVESSIIDSEMRKIYIKPNQDYSQTAGGEEYGPDAYLGLLKHAHILIGNSSSFLKEASVYGTPTILVGGRQNGRLRPQQVAAIACERATLRHAIWQERNRGYAKYTYPSPYYQSDTAKRMALKIRELV